MRSLDIARAMWNGLVVGDKATPDSWKWDADTQRYRWPNTGRAVPPKLLRKAVERIQESHRADMGTHTRGLLEGSLSPEEWQRAMRLSVKNAHIQMRVAGRGGRDQMTKSDWGKVGQLLRKEYGYLDNFALDVVTGNLTDAQITIRASLYGGANVLGQYERGRLDGHREAGYDQKIRYAAGDANTCDTCNEEAAQGWVDIDEPGWVLGDTDCQSNDRCDFDYRRSPDAAGGPDGADDGAESDG